MAMQMAMQMVWAGTANAYMVSEDDYVKMKLL